MAVDPGKGRAYIALPDLDPKTGNGRVAVLDVTVDPDTTNPLVTIVDLGHPDFAGGIAIDPSSGTVMVTSGQNLHCGFLDLISESNNSLIAGAHFAFPAGADSGIKAFGTGSGEVLFNPLNNHAVVSTSDCSTAAAGDTCPAGAGNCVGFADFDLTSKTFGPIIQTHLADEFAFNATLNQIIAPSDAIDPGIGDGTNAVVAVDIPNSRGCTLSDANMTTLNADPDGVGIDPVTNIVVLGNFSSSQATVINLQGSTFASATPAPTSTASPSASPTPGCVLNEGGTPPNSANVDTMTNANMPGVAVNPISHQAFLTADGGNPIALLGLPTTAQTQLDPASVTSLAQSTVPNTPSGNAFTAAAFPYGTVVDVNNNFAYVLNNLNPNSSASYDYLVRIDLTAFKNSPAAISTALPNGNCAGTSTTSSCKNGNGVVFFPLPPNSAPAVGSAN